VFALALESALGFSVVLDDGGKPIAGRARVVREISLADAASCGLTAGFGLEITELTEIDRARCRRKRLRVACWVREKLPDGVRMIEEVRE